MFDSRQDQEILVYSTASRAAEAIQPPVNLVSVVSTAERGQGVRQPTHLHVMPRATVEELQLTSPFVFTSFLNI